MYLKNICIVVSFLNCTPVHALELPSFDGITSWFSFIKTEDVSAEYPVKQPAKIIVTNNYGNTTIELWNLPQIRITALKQARTEETLKATAVITNMTEHGGQPTVMVETKSSEDAQEDKTVVDYTIFIPKGTDIRISHHNKGSVFIKAINYSPEATARLGNVTVNTNKGSITVQSENPITNSMILKTGKGNVSLNIPQVTNARLEAHTRKGAITSTIPVTLDPVTTTLSGKQWQQMMQHVQGMLGTESEGFISVDVGSGNIEIGNE